MAGRQVVFGPVDDLLLHLRVEILEIGRVSRNPHNLVWIFLGMLHPIFQGFPVNDVELYLQAPRFANTRFANPIAEVSLNGVGKGRRLGGLGEELQIQGLAVGDLQDGPSHSQS